MVAPAAAFINNANKASVNYNVVLPARSRVASDTITFNVNDVGSAHTIGPLTKPESPLPGTDTFNANDLSASTTARSPPRRPPPIRPGTPPRATSTTNTKDTSAPTVDSVSLTGGNLVGGTTYINAANKAALGFSVGWTAGS